MKQAGRIKFVKIAIAVAVAAVVVFLCIKYYPNIMFFMSSGSLQDFVRYIDSLGWVGMIVFIGVHALQVVIAFLPGEPVELAAGILYGPLWGTVLCVIGALIGTIAVFYIVKAFGHSAALVFFKEKELSKLKFLQNTKKLKVILFILFFIPGTPKDIITYFAPLTPIEPLPFFIIVTIARFPSIITSTLAGASITDGEFTKGVVIFSITAVVGLLGILVYNKLVDKNKDNKNE